MYGSCTKPYEDRSVKIPESFREAEEKRPDVNMPEEQSRVVTKESFVQGFVPHHNHGSIDYTSYVNGHMHQCLDITLPPTPLEGGSHVHMTEGYVLFENGHNHHYKACSGPAIPVGDGMHVHYYDFYTSEDYNHRHHVAGVDMPAPGTV
jgi:hypothetical protein